MMVSTKQDLVDFAKKHGKMQTAHLLQQAWGKLELYKALSTYPGEVLLRQMQSDWISSFKKSLDFSATQEDRMRFKIINELLESWASKVAHAMQIEEGRIDDAPTKS